jgi:FAD:protein FMN transferase
VDIEQNQIVSFTGLGTVWNVELPLSTSQTIIKEVKQIVLDFNNNYSRFLDSSLVGRLNKDRKIICDKPNSSEFLELLKIGQKYHKITKGSFNFLLGKKLESFGYDKDYSFKNSSTKTKLPNPQTDIIIKNNFVELKSGGVDFGGFGKGFLVDKLVRFLSVDHRLGEFVINAGGDIFSYSGGQKINQFYLSHPIKKDQFVGKVSLCNQALAGSSTYLRSWPTKVGQKNHIIDPNSQDSIKPSAVFVIANSTIQADIWATVVSVLDKAQIDSFANEYSFDYLKITPRKIYLSKNFPILKI